jgi:hypothetical protein
MSDYIHSNWQKWFAWFPVQTVNDRWVWLRTIYRRPVFKGYGDMRHFSFWFYGDILDVLYFA